MGTHVAASTRIGSRPPVASTVHTTRGRLRYVRGTTSDVSFFAFSR